MRAAGGSRVTSTAEQWSARGRAISVIPENWVLSTAASRARTKVVARLIVGRTLLKKKKEKGKKEEKKEMRGRTRELCREANDAQNWFADIMRTRRVVSPALFYVSENIPRLQKRVLHEKREVERQHPLPPLPQTHRFSPAILHRFSREVRTHKSSLTATTYDEMRRSTTKLMVHHYFIRVN